MVPLTSIPSPLSQNSKKLAKDDIDYGIRSRKRLHREQKNWEGELGPNQLPEGRVSETPF